MMKLDNYDISMKNHLYINDRDIPSIRVVGASFTSYFIFNFRLCHFIYIINNLITTFTFHISKWQVNTLHNRHLDKKIPLYDEFFLHFVCYTCSNKKMSENIKRSQFRTKIFILYFILTILIKSSKVIVHK